MINEAVLRYHALVFFEGAAVNSKNRQISFPYRWTLERHSGNPVLRALPGTWEASWFTVDDVIKVDGEFWMYYGGSDRGNKNTQLGMAISDDGVKWRRHPDNPIWESGWSHFLRDVRVYRFDISDFWMYYSDGDRHIDLARSSDGIRWENYMDNPVLERSQPWEDLLMQERILRINEKWYMWYSTYSGKPRVTGMAMSQDGVKWQKYEGNPVLTLGKPGRWDDFSAFQPNVFYRDGHFHMIYTGSSRENPTGYRLGYAVSRDGIHWEKSPQNPVFAPGNEEAWDGGKVSCPTLMPTGRHTFNIYYAGAARPDATYQGIGLARAGLRKINNT